MNTKKLTPTERKLMRKEMKDWEPHTMVYNAGDIFDIYHNILMMRISAMHRIIVQQYWNTFFREHELPTFMFSEDCKCLEVCYISTSDLILERVKDQLKNKLNKIDTLL